MTITGVTTIVLNPDGDWSITNPQPGVAQITLNGLTVNRTYVTNVTCDSSGNLVLTTATDVFRDGLLVG